MEMTDKEELLHDAETGRRYKIAMEVWREFLDNRREEIVKEIESGEWDTDKLCELYVLKKFREISCMNIQRGEIAEEELAHGE